MTSIVYHTSKEFSKTTQHSYTPIVIWVIHFTFSFINGRLLSLLRVGHLNVYHLYNKVPMYVILCRVNHPRNIIFLELLSRG